MKSNALIIFLLAFLSNTIAQNTVELLSISQHYGVPQKYDSVYAGTADEKIFKAELTVPIILSDSNIWYNSVYYEKINVATTNALPVDVANPLLLNALSLRTGIIHSFKNNQAVYMFFAPRMQGDYKNINLKTFHAGCVALYEKKYRDDFAMRFGFAYYHDYVGPFFAPLVYIYRQFTPKFKIVGTMPQDFRIHYKINRKWAVGGQQYAASNVFHLGNKKYMDDYIIRKSITLSTYVRRKLIEDIYMEVFAGYAYDREYTQYFENDKIAIRFPAVEFGWKNGTPKTVRFDDGLFFSARIVLDFPVPN